MLSFQITYPSLQSMYLLLRTWLTQFLVVSWVTHPFECEINCSSQPSLNPFSFISRSLAEAWAKAHSTPSSGAVVFIPPPLLLPDDHAIKHRLLSNPQDHISPNLLQPLIPAAQSLTKWLTPYGLSCLDQLSFEFPTNIIIHHHQCLAKCIQPTTLSNYLASLLQFTKFCDDYGVPESDRMLALESLLSHSIATWGAALVSKSTLKLWLEGLRLWHQINKAPWHGSHMLKRIVTGASKLAPAKSSLSKWEPITIEHLRSLCHNLDLANIFGIAIFAIACVAFWCCCR